MEADIRNIRGIVDEVGPGVTLYKKGDRVVSRSRRTGYVSGECTL